MSSSQATGRPMSSSLGTVSSRHQLPTFPDPRGCQFTYREGASLSGRGKQVFGSPGLASGILGAFLSLDAH